MDIKELNDTLGRILGMKAGEVTWFQTSIVFESKELFLAIRVNPESAKAKRIKSLIREQLLGESK